METMKLTIMDKRPVDLGTMASARCCDKDNAILDPFSSVDCFTLCNDLFSDVLGRWHVLSLHASKLVRELILSSDVLNLQHILKKKKQLRRAAL